MGRMKVPVAFLIHASEDKARFVVPFATALMARGVKVWLDKWEILPGDSLVKKIFDEGLDSADAVIIVISAASATKPWVREELDASVVAKINKGLRIIPVVLENAHVPAPLRHLLWVNVPNIAEFSSAVDEIVAVLHGMTAKPPLGAPPPYVTNSSPIPDRTPMEATVLKIFCDLAMEAGDRFGIMTEDAVTRAESIGLTEEDVLQTAQSLVELYDLEPSKVLAEVPPHFTVTSHGFIRCVSAVMPEYKDVYHAVASAIINGRKDTNQEIVNETGANPLLVNQILELMAEKRYLVLDKFIGNLWQVSNPSRRLKDVLRGT
jgi:hypothetical protein